MINPTTIDRVVRWSIIPMIAGVGCWFFGLVISTFMLVGLGAMGGSFSEWRTEHGLWMLGTLFLILFGGIYALFFYHSLLDAIAGRALIGALAIDVLIGTSTLAFMVRFLRSVTFWNQLLSKGQHER